MFKQPSEEDILKRKVDLGKRTRNKLLILDMDETLIHAKYITDED